MLDHGAVLGSGDPFDEDEVQLPGVSTKDNPEMAATLVRPARLDFRMVHPTIAPPAEAPPGYERMTLVQEARPGMAGYTEEQAIRLLTKGVTRRGVPPQRPMPPFAFSEEDAKAIFAYLNTI